MSPRSLRGSVPIPGDKSISHRALLLNALSTGRAQVRGLLDSEDVASTARCLRALGVDIVPQADGSVVVTGRGGLLSEPADVLDCGNSGTTMRLLCGVLAGQPLHAVLTGDASLRGRPMARVAEPLRQLGARVDGRGGGALAPLSIRGGALHNLRFETAVASAQVKSALLLAGLRGVGRLEVAEPHPSRDHTERMLGAMGVVLEQTAQGCALEGGQPLSAVDVDVPGDISSATFFLVAASVLAGSEVVLPGVGLNPTRTGALEALRRMGADITVVSPRVVSGEPVGDLVVRAAPLRGITLEGAEIPRLIDEVPVLAVAAALAEGETVIRDAAELRVKESDRVATTAALLRALGGTVEILPDGLVIQGRPGGLVAGVVEAQGDHRIAMAGAVALAAARGDGGVVRGAEAAGVSFPAFFETLRRLQQGG